MKIFQWKTWGITARLAVITALPVVLMFGSVVLFSSYSRYAEVQEEIAERGQVLAAALANSSEYGVVSGNLSYAERTIRALLQHDRSIARVEILNVDRRSMLDVTNAHLANEELQTFEAPIKKELVEINAFAEEGVPHVSSPADPASTSVAGKPLGFVRVAMTPSLMLAKQKHRLVMETGIAGIVLMISALLGLVLALSLTRPLAQTIAALRQIKEGNYGIRPEVTASGEIGELQSSIVDMAASLDEFRQDLEGKVMARTCDLEAARDQAVKSNRENRKLIQKVNSVVEEERKSIAIELHDQLNAHLIVVRLESQRVLDLAAKQPANAIADEIKAKAQSIITLTSDLYALCRNIVRRLRPEVIDTLGLRDAVEDMIHHYDDIHATCRFELQAKGDFSHLEGELAMSAYRLIQEALSNVVKHSSATTAFVGLHLRQDRKTLQILVRDNGRGFEPKAIDPGIGLIGMRERVCGLDGKLEIKTALDAGTTIAIELPVREDVFAEGGSPSNQART